MGLLLGIVGVVAAAWLFARESGGKSEAAVAALQAIRENDALTVAAWQKLEDSIIATDDVDLTCALLLEMKRTELPAEIVDLWRYVDELAESCNRRAEHYETVAHAPAPPLAGRAESERVMRNIRRCAARAARDSSPPRG